MSIFYMVAFWILVAVMIVLTTWVIDLRRCIMAQNDLNYSVDKFLRSLMDWVEHHEKKH